MVQHYQFPLEVNQKVSEELSVKWALISGQVANPGNTEQGKCRLTNEYLFFIGHWFYKKYFVFIKTTYSSRYSFVACNSRYI